MARKQSGQGALQAMINYAVAVRDGDELFLFLTIARAPAGDIYVNIFASSLFGMGRNVVVLAWSGGTSYLVTFLGSAESGRFSVPA
jgi:hypothetical protein